VSEIAVNDTKWFHSFRLPDTSQPRVCPDRTSSNIQPARSYPRAAANPLVYPAEAQTGRRITRSVWGFDLACGRVGASMHDERCEGEYLGEVA
jgi:hypothetical protein